MKVILEDFLHKIDQSFKSKTQKDIYMTYIMIFGLIFTFSYLLFWGNAEVEYININKRIESVKTQIQNDELYLRTNPEAKIVQLQNDIKASEAQAQIHKENNEYIKTKIETISSIVYNEVAWGEYLHSISEKAKKYDVELINLTNGYNLNSKSFGHILDITISSNSNYQNTLKFINSLEQSDLVVDIHDFNIKSDDKLLTDLNISVWGIVY